MKIIRHAYFCGMQLGMEASEDGTSSFIESELGREAGASCNQRVVSAIQERARMAQIELHEQ